MRPLPFPESATESVIMTLNTKECNTCHEVKPVENFRYERNKCKSCEAQYRKDRAEQFKAANSQLTLEEIWNRTPQKKCSKCKETLPSTEFSRSNYTNSGLQEVCRDCSSERKSEWARNNLDKCREKNARYRAKKRGLFWEDLNLDQIVERDGTLTCAWCGVLGDVVHIDHVRPLDLDGIHAPFNLVASCASCNTSKGATDPGVWLAQCLSQGITGIPSPSALEAVRLAYSGIHEDLAAQISLTKQNVALTA